MKLQPIETAPRDRCILLHAGYPWLVVGHYNEYHQEWVYASLQAQKMDTGDSDHYFENEHDKKPLGWMPLPEIN